MDSHDSPNAAGAISTHEQPEQGQNQAELASIDPDETQFRADTLLMHSELVELELYAIRRKWFSDPDATKIHIGAGNPAEQTIRGYQRDPFNGVVIYNPTPATLAVGFQAGLGVLAPATVPPFSFATFPERFVNLSIALLNPADAQAQIAKPVTILRLRYPPVAAAGPFTSPVPPQPLASLTAAAAIAPGQALDNGYPRANHSLIVVTSAGVTGGVVQLQGSHDGQNYANLGAGITTNAASSVFQLAAQAAMRYLRAAISTAIIGGTVNATIASS